MNTDVLLYKARANGSFSAAAFVLFCAILINMTWGYSRLAWILLAMSAVETFIGVRWSYMAYREAKKETP